MAFIKWWIFILLSFSLAAFLMLVPLPDYLHWYRPLFSVLWVIFCQLQFPRQFNPWYGFLGGIITDALLGSLLGIHALLFSLLAYTTALLRPQFLGRPFWQQLGKVIVLVGLTQIMSLWFHVLSGQNPKTLMVWLTVLSSTLIWPLWVLIQNALSRLTGCASYTARAVIS